MERKNNQSDKVESTGNLQSTSNTESSKRGLIDSIDNQNFGISCLHEAIDLLGAIDISTEKLPTYKDKKYTFFDPLNNKEETYDYFNEERGWLHYALIKGIGKDCGINGKWENPSKNKLLNKLKSYLNEGFFVAVSLKAEFWGDNSSIGHIVLVKSIMGNNENGIVTINDPNKIGENILIKSKKFIRYYNNKILVFCKNEYIGNDKEKMDEEMKIKINERMNEMLTCSPLVANEIQNEPGPVFLHVHEVEKLSRELAIEGVKKHGGKLVYLSQNNERWLRYFVNGQALRIDPNRIFSDQGLEKTISERNSHLHITNLPDAIKLGTNIRNYILDKIGNRKEAIIAMHNNTRLDINKYCDETKYIYINPDFPKDCFVLTNNLDYFFKLGDLDISVVHIVQPIKGLQDQSDDGSLYNYFQAKGRNYFNIEAGYEDKYWQEKMMNGVLKIIE